MLPKEQLSVQDQILRRLTRILLYALTGIVLLLLGLAVTAALTGDGLIAGFEAVGIAASTAGWAEVPFHVLMIGKAVAVASLIGYVAALALLLVLVVRALRWALGIG